MIGTNVPIMALGRHGNDGQMRPSPVNVVIVTGKERFGRASAFKCR